MLLLTGAWVAEGLRETSRLREASACARRVCEIAAWESDTRWTGETFALAWTEGVTTLSVPVARAFEFVCARAHFRRLALLLRWHRPGPLGSVRSERGACARGNTGSTRAKWKVGRSCGASWERGAVVDSAQETRGCGGARAEACR